MKKLFPGCRVRILYSLGWPELKGEQGTVLGRSSPGITGVSEWQVAPDIWGTHIAPRIGAHGGISFAPASEQLEPILPKGAAPGDFSYQELMDSLKEAMNA